VTTGVAAPISGSNPSEINVGAPIISIFKHLPNFSDPHGVEDTSKQSSYIPSSECDDQPSGIRINLTTIPSVYGIHDSGSGIHTTAHGCMEPPTTTRLTIAGLACPVLVVFAPKTYKRL